MKTWITLLFISTFMGPYAQQLEPTPVPLILDEKVTRLWAQEYIGSDLVREELEEWNQQFNHTLKVPLSIVDLGFEKDHITLTEEIPVPRQMNGKRFMRANHGTSVANLLTGPSEYRVSDQVSLMNLTRVNFQGMYGSMWRRFERNNRFPKVITNSLGWSDPKIPEIVEKADQQNILWFLAAGNDYPTPVRILEKESKAIMIGSFAPSGLTSYETQNDAKLVVLAPANEELATINGYGKEHLFGATSGATPLVAGTVINILSFLPSLNRDQTIHLIKKTAFKSVENKLGLTEMPGLLNGYKLFRVAKRIYEECHEDLECIQEKIYLESTYQFKNEQEVVICETIKNLAPSEEEKKQLTLKDMRRLSFLGSIDQMRELSCAYKYLGYEKNSEYFAFLAEEQAPLREMERKANLAHDKALYQISYYRYGPYYSDEYELHIKASEMNEHHKLLLLDLKKEHLSGR